MPRYALAPGLSYGLVDSEPIFLDLAADLYFKLDPPLRAAFDRLRNGNGTLPRTGAAGLLAAGIVRESPARAPLAPAPAFIPEGSLAGMELQAHVRWADLPEVALLLVRARLAIRCTGLGRLAAARASRASPDHEQRARTLARRFEAARRRIPLARHCLTDSLALLHFLRRRSLSAHLLFGVKRHPFAAHCWLQDRRMVLNDDAETARGFTPVLVL
jgi:hypothetical protein